MRWMCLALALLLTKGAGAAAMPWRVCLPDTPFPPFLLNDAGRLGLSEKLMLEAGRRAGLALSFQRLPIARCRALVQQGAQDSFIAPEAAAALPSLRFPRLPGSEALDATRRLVAVRFLWVQRRDAGWRWEGGALQQFPVEGAVGMRQGYLGGVGAVKALGLRVDQSGVAAAQVLQMLRHHRVEAAVLMDVELEPALQQAGGDDLRVLATPLRTEHYYAAVSQRRELALAEAWWKQITLLRDLPAYRP